MQPSATAPSRIEVVLQPPPAAPSNSGLITAALALAWPVAIVIVVVILRQAISDAVRALAARATKLSIGMVAVDLASASARSWGGSPLDELRDTAVTAPVGDSSSALVASLGDETAADYAVVDLGTGQEWITSRLFLVATLVARMRRLRAVVFVTAVPGPMTLLGTCDVEVLRGRLASRFPWLELAYVEAQAASFRGLTPAAVAPGQLALSQDGRLESWRAGDVLREFKRAIQFQGVAAPGGEGWELLGQQLWERAEWVTAESLSRLLGAALVRTAAVVDLATSDRQLAQQVLRADGPFVPVVDDQRIFQRLINRTTFVSRGARLLADD